MNSGANERNCNFRGEHRLRCSAGCPYSRSARGLWLLLLCTPGKCQNIAIKTDQSLVSIQQLRKTSVSANDLVDSELRSCLRIISSSSTSFHHLRSIICNYRQSIVYNSDTWSAFFSCNCAYPIRVLYRIVILMYKHATLTETGKCHSQAVTMFYLYYSGGPVVGLFSVETHAATAERQTLGRVFNPRIVAPKTTWRYLDVALPSNLMANC